MASPIGTELQNFSKDYVESGSYMKTTQTKDRVLIKVKFTKAEDAGKMTSDERAKCQALLMNLNMYHEVVHEYGFNELSQTLSQKIMNEYQQFRRDHGSISIKNFHIGH